MNKKILKTALATLLGGLSYQVAKTSIQIMRGNDDLYAPSKEFYNPTSRLNGKTIVFLGSSITTGRAARGDSFVDYLNIEHGVQAQKEAVNESSLAGAENNSYVKRLIENVDPNQDLDALVCQISINDQSHGKPIGTISNSFNRDDFDIDTLVGAIEYIVSYTNATWNCPIIFFTCPHKENSLAAELRNQLFQLQRKWLFEIIDIWNNQAIQKLTQKHPEYMADDCHPTRAGYRYCWTPVFVRELDQLVD